jgi:AraC-like DNA-binding protein
MEVALHNSSSPCLAERCDLPEFFIVDECRKNLFLDSGLQEHFRIQVGPYSATAQHIAGVVRGCPSARLTFLLPRRVQFARHLQDSPSIAISFSPRFLKLDLDAASITLEDIDLARARELAPFLFQEYLDFTFGPLDFIRLRELVDAMRSESRERAFGSSEILRGLLLQLIGLTCRRFEMDILRLAATYARQPRRRDAFGRVTRYIGEHLTDDISLADAASAAFLSPNHLAHLLKKETGHTFTELVTERRLARARELLARTTNRIADIAHACGFADEAYFTRRFKRWSGLSPRAYRANQSKKSVTQS